MMDNGLIILIASVVVGGMMCFGLLLLGAGVWWFMKKKKEGTGTESPATPSASVPEVESVTPPPQSPEAGTSTTCPSCTAPSSSRC